MMSEFTVHTARHGDGLERRLIGRLEDDLTSCLGEPKTRNITEWRYGYKGSLSINVGQRRGLWCDFETEDGGRILALLARRWELDPASDRRELDERAEALFESPLDWNAWLEGLAESGGALGLDARGRD
jgi:hypothetical protein